MDVKLTSAVILAILGYGTVAYTAMFIVAGSAVARAGGDTLSIFNCKAVFLECLGIVLRKVRKYITFRQELSWSQVFKLDPNRASYADVEQASLRMLLRMRQLRWYYPQSQRQVILRLAAQGFKHIQLREIYAAAMREHLRNTRTQSHYEQAAAPAPAQASGWRAVLGVTAHECDINVIKKAYRTRALKAHPDRGGSDAAMATLNNAIAQARKELSFV